MKWTMRKFILAIAAIAVSLASFAQAKVTTKKMKLADFPQKVTKVVLTGNGLHDARLQNAVKANWTISPVEFCTLDEFNASKSNPDYYFLLSVKGQFKKEVEPGLEFLSLVKGGIGASGDENDLFQVVDVPFRAINDHNGREYVVLPALLTIIQDYVTKSIDSDLDGYVGLSNYNINLGKSKGMKIVLAEEDLAADVMPSVREKFFKPDMEVVSADDADDIFLENTPNTLVSFVIAPADAEPNSYCYKFLIDAGTYNLYYFRKHKISRKSGAGFLSEDVKRISASR